MLLHKFLKGDTTSAVMPGVWVLSSTYCSAASPPFTEILTQRFWQKSEPGPSPLQGLNGNVSPTKEKT